LATFSLAAWGVSTVACRIFHSENPSASALAAEIKARELSALGRRVRLYRNVFFDADTSKNAARDEVQKLIQEFSREVRLSGNVTFVADPSKPMAHDDIQEPISVRSG
jgi:hypothetical protein